MIVGVVTWRLGESKENRKGRREPGRGGRRARFAALLGGCPDVKAGLNSNKAEPGRGKTLSTWAGSCLPASNPDY